MAYPPLAAARRPRRRAVVAIFVILALVAGVITLAVQFRTERRDTVDYLALVKEITEEHLVMSSSLEDLFSSLGELARQDILDRLTDLDLEAEALRARLDGVTVTSAVGEANGFFIVALESWGGALAGLSVAVIEVLDGEDEGRLGDPILATSFADLEVGDRAYEGFRAAVDRIDPDLVRREYPEFGYAAGGRQLLYDPGIIADRLRITLRFEENRDISVLATTDPAPLGSDNGMPVVPYTEAFSVQVVVTNEGNVIEKLTTISLRLESGGGESVQEHSEIVELLDAGEATTVEFAGLTVLPGQAYILQVTADVSDDDEPGNNTWELVFIRNEQ
jgi:hypothetical protein